MIDAARIVFGPSDAPHTPLSKFTAGCGVFYMVAGIAYAAAPNAMHALAPDVVREFQGGEVGLVRALGMTLFVIGYLYFFGAKARADVFGLSTVFDRIIVVPIVLGALVASGQIDATLGVPFAVLDPTLGIIAYVIWKRSPSGSSPTAPRAPRPPPDRAARS